MLQAREKKYGFALIKHRVKGRERRINDAERFWPSALAVATHPQEHFTSLSSSLSLFLALALSEF